MAVSGLVELWSRQIQNKEVTHVGDSLVPSKRGLENSLSSSVQHLESAMSALRTEVSQQQPQEQAGLEAIDASAVSDSVAPSSMKALTFTGQVPDLTCQDPCKLQVWAPGLLQEMAAAKEERAVLQQDVALLQRSADEALEISRRVERELLDVQRHLFQTMANQGVLQTGLEKTDGHLSTIQNLQNTIVDLQTIMDERQAHYVEEMSKLRSHFDVSEFSHGVSERVAALETMCQGFPTCLNLVEEKLRVDMHSLSEDLAADRNDRLRHQSGMVEDCRQMAEQVISSVVGNMLEQLPASGGLPRTQGSGSAFEDASTPSRGVPFSESPKNATANRRNFQSSPRMFSSPTVITDANQSRVVIATAGTTPTVPKPVIYTPRMRSCPQRESKMTAVSKQNVLVMSNPASCSLKAHSLTQSPRSPIPTPRTLGSPR